MIELESIRLEKQLKSAGHSCIYLARDRESGQRRIYREFEGKGDVYQKLAQLHCPHLPQIYQVQEVGNRTAVVEEFITGDTLAFLLEKGFLSEAEAADIICQLCDALTVLHQAGIVHRDIKPENLILRGSELVLIDFDVSRISNPTHNSDTRIMGTTGYAAPEQYGFSQTDARADLYAAGVTFNEMLIGQHPSRALAAGPFRPVIERCIEVNVDKRYQTAAELRAAVLRRLHYRKRRRLWLTVAGVSAAAILALGIFDASRPRPVQGETAPSVEAAALPEVPEAGTQAAAVTPEGTEPPAFEPIRTQLPLSEDTAPAVNQGFTTAFAYDLDGDGTEEEYFFGTLHQNIPAGYQHTLSDSFGIAAGDMSERTVFPCVWKTDADGSIVPVPEFAEKLIQPQVKLQRTEGNESPAPAIYEADNSVWHGGVQVLFSIENLGSWYYSASATLDGQTLTAATMSHVFDISKQFQ